MLTMIDVSMWQGEVNWPRVKQDGIELAYIKATQGVREIDPRYAVNRAHAAALGIRVGSYLYAEPNGGSALAQATHFATVVGRLGRRELRPAIDLETGAPATLEHFARELSRSLTTMLGPAPLFYSYPDFIARMRLERTIGGGLWLASYGRDDGADHGADVPKPWKAWVAHQYTSKGSAPGIAGAVDFSHAPRLRPLLAHPITGIV